MALIFVSFVKERAKTSKQTDERKKKKEIFSWEVPGLMTKKQKGKNTGRNSLFLEELSKRATKMKLKKKRNVIVKGDFSFFLFSDA